MEKEFYFEDENNVKTVFHRQLYLDLLCKYVKDILKKDVDTEVYEHFKSWFNSLNNYNDVYGLTHEGDEYMAILLSGGGIPELKNLSKEQLNAFTSLRINYCKEKGISVIVEKF